MSCHARRGAVHGHRQIAERHTPLSCCVPAFAYRIKGSCRCPYAIPRATVIRLRMLDNWSSVIREGVGLTRRNDTLVT